ncbi:helix-turn-helix domain-containing protein [Acinetobacter baylyi]|uniref:helix-turn-helix domain-containing protein n=1 Tax=Acinetobacter baylyi TaxID=202950 RepID=UPI000EA3BBC7|nr:helix-turn-helix transcriptional regulator [Acinetobacter baylyi]
MTNSIYTNEMLALRLWLKNQRKSQKISMRHLAERMDKPHSFIQKVEQGERRLDVVEYVWYCSALGINPQTGIDLVKQHYLHK